MMQYFPSRTRPTRKRHDVLPTMLACLFVSFFIAFSAKTQDFNNFSLESASPHIAWAKPLSGNNIDALMIAPRSAMRDAVELHQRLDLDLATAAVWDPEHLGHDPAHPGLHLPGSDAESVTQHLEAKLRNAPDLILLAQIELSILPESVQTRIVELVRNGAGLVLSYCTQSKPSALDSLIAEMEPVTPERSFGDGIGETPLPEWADIRDCAMPYEYEAGRVVVLDYPGDFPAYHALLPAPAEAIPASVGAMENLYAMLARAFRWAAQREPDIWIIDVVDIGPRGPEDAEVPPDIPELFIMSIRDSIQNQPLRPYRVQLNTESDRRMQIRAQLRNLESGEVQIYEDLGDLARGSELYLLDLLVEPGEYHLDVWLLDRRGIVDWHTRTLDVAGWPEIENLQPSKTFLLPNDSLELSCHVRPVLSTSRQATLYARAKTPSGDIVAENYQILSAEGGDVQLYLSFADLDTPLVTVEMFALNGAINQFSELMLSAYPRERRYFPVRRVLRDTKWRIGVYADDLQEFNSRFYLRQLHQAGVDLVLAPGGHGNLYHAANAQLAFIPELSRYTARQGQAGMVREPCLRDTAYQQQERQELRDQVLIHWAGATGAYSLGRKNTLTQSDENLCQCPRCLDAFVDYVRDEFDNDIQGFQQRWNLPFADWSQAQPARDYRSGIHERYAPWMDFRRFMQDSFGDFMDTQREVLQEVDVDAWVGMGSYREEGPMHGYDWSRLARELDFLTFPYDPVLIRKLQTYHTPRVGSGIQIDTETVQKPPETIQKIALKALLYGFPTVWLETPYSDIANPGPHAALLPDGRPGPMLENLSALKAQFERGLGEVLLSATRASQPVGIFDSQAAALMAEVEPQYQQRKQEAEAHWLQLFLNMGYDPVFVDATQLQGFHEIAMLVLPQCHALSNDDMEAILRFVDQGGIVIADVLPGLRDAHGALRDYNPLQEIFELHSDVEGDALDDAEVSTVPAALFGNLPGAQDTPLPMQRAWQAIDSTRAVAVGDKHIWIRNDWEDADLPPALLLNHPLTSAAHLRTHVQQSFVQPLLELAAIAHPLQEILQDPDAFVGESFRFHYGAAEITVLLPGETTQRNNRQRLRLDYDRESFVYDVLAQTPVAFPYRARITVTDEAPLILARLPHEISRLEVLPDLDPRAGGRLHVRLQLHYDEEDAPPPARHQVYISLREGPMQRELKRFSRTVELRDGVAETYIPLPRNIMPGQKTLYAEEVFSGVRNGVNITIMPAQF